MIFTCISVILEIANKHNSVWTKENCSIPSIYVLLAFLKEVIEEQRVSHYEMVINELTRLYDVSGNTVPFNVYARLIVALRALVSVRYYSLKSFIILVHQFTFACSLESWKVANQISFTAAVSCTNRARRSWHDFLTNMSGWSEYSVL